MNSTYGAPSAASASDSYVEVALDTARLAQRAARSIERRFLIGGHGISVQFAGSAMPALLTPALEHLASPGTPAPGLNILVWDSRSTGIAMPKPPWTVDAYSLRGEVEGLDEGRFRAAYQTDFGGFSVIDLKRGVAAFWVADASDLTSSEQAAPFLRILHWWMRRKGQQVLHAAAVGRATGGVVLGGAGGSGKSGTALACLNAGLRYAADDYCLLDPGPPAIIHSLYNSAKVHTRDLARLPFLVRLVSNPTRDEGEKAVCFVNQHFPSRLATDLHVRAILLPQVTPHAETRVEPATPTEAVRVLAPSTVSQLPHAGETAFRTITALARHVPAYRLNLGRDVEQIPGVILSLLS